MSCMVISLLQSKLTVQSVQFLWYRGNCTCLIGGYKPFHPLPLCTAGKIQVIYHFTLFFSWGILPSATGW